MVHSDSPQALRGRRHLVLYAVGVATLLHGLFAWFLWERSHSRVLPQPKKRIEVTLVTPPPTPVVPVTVATPPPPSLPPPKTPPVVTPLPQPQPVPAKPLALPQERAVDEVSKPLPVAEPAPVAPVAEPVRPVEHPQSVAVAPPIAESKPEVQTSPGFDAAYLNNPKPVYPASARRMGLEGVVILRVKVDVHGKPQEVQVITSSGSPILDKSALDIVSQQWTFVPARQGQRPVSGVVDVPIRFSLR